MLTLQIQFSLIAGSFLIAQLLNGLVVNWTLLAWFCPILVSLELMWYAQEKRRSRNAVRAAEERRNKLVVPIDQAKKIVTAELIALPTTRLAVDSNSLPEEGLPDSLRDFFATFQAVSLDFVEIRTDLVREFHWPGYIEIGNGDNGGTTVIVHRGDGRVWEIDSSVAPEDLDSISDASIWHFLLSQLED